MQESNLQGVSPQLITVSRVYRFTNPEVISRGLEPPTSRAVPSALPLSYETVEHRLAFAVHNTRKPVCASGASCRPNTNEPRPLRSFAAVPKEHSRGLRLRVRDANGVETSTRNGVEVEACSREHRPGREF